jgi:hypothetical protein
VKECETVSGSLDFSVGRIVALSQGYLTLITLGQDGCIVWVDLMMLLADISDQLSEIASGQIQDLKLRNAQLNRILYTDSQDMLLLSTTIASHSNCCTDGSTSP